MKRLFALTALLFVLPIADAGGRRWVPPMPTVVGGAGNITADLWSKFETAAPDATTLKAQSSGSAVSASAWALFGGTATTSTSANKAPFSTVNSTTDSGTKGWVSDHNTTPNFQIDLNSYPTTQSVGFAYQCTALDSGGYSVFYGLGEGIGSSVCIIRARIDNTAGTYTITLENVGGVAGTSVTVSAATWYWITIKVIETGTCSLRVYNFSGTQIGSTVTATGNTKNPFYHIFTSTSNSASGNDYLDNVVIDKTTATFPLGP